MTGWPGTKVWTSEEKNLLEYMVGVSTLNQIKHAFPERTLDAIKRQAHRQGFNLTRGAWTLNSIIRETGYDWSQIERARDALGQHWRRMRRGGKKFLIDDDQMQEIVKYLANEPVKYLSIAGYPRKRWATHYDRCVSCGANGKRYSDRHLGKGLCVRCSKKRKTR